MHENCILVLSYASSASMYSCVACTVLVHVYDDFHSTMYRIQQKIRGQCALGGVSHAKILARSRLARGETRTNGFAAAQHRCQPRRRARVQSADSTRESGALLLHASTFGWDY